MSKIQIFGNADKQISEALKCYLIQDFGGEISCVVGIIGEGTTKEIVANWESPFEDVSLGSMFKKVGGMIQKITDLTSLSTLSSTQTWGGNEPYLFDLALKLYALYDPWIEVEGAIKTLEKMAAPEIHEVMPGGQVPQPVMIKLGRHMIFPKSFIKSLSIPMDTERSADGRMMRCTVNVQIGSIKMQNRTDIDAMYR